MNTLIVIESLTIVNLLNKVQFPFVKVFPPQMLSSSSEGAIVQAVPIAFAPVITSQRSFYFEAIFDVKADYLELFVLSTSCQTQSLSPLKTFPINLIV